MRTEVLQYRRASQEDELVLWIVPGMGCVDQDGTPVLTSPLFSWEAGADETAADLHKHE